MVKYIIIAVVIAVSLVVSCAGDRPANVTNNTRVANAASPATSPLAAATVDPLTSGAKLYEANCAGCHREDGSGGPMEIEGKKIDPDDLTSDKMKKFSDEKILGYILNGVPDEGMPAFKGKLSESEMRDVVKYLRTEIQKIPTDQVGNPKG